MGGCLILHCTLNGLISILFITDDVLKVAFITVKCYDYYHGESFYYVDILSLYHFLNEYVPCMVIIILMNIQFSAYNTFHQEQNDKHFGEDMENMDKTFQASEKLRKSLTNLDDILNDN